MSHHRGRACVAFAIAVSVPASATAQGMTVDRGRSRDAVAARATDPAGASTSQLRPTPVVAVTPREDRPAVGWTLGPGYGNGAAGRTLDMAVFGDLPVGPLRVRVDAGLLGANFQADDGREHASIRRVGLQLQRRFGLGPDDPLVQYLGIGMARQFWRFDRLPDANPSDPRFDAVAGLEFLEPGGRLGVLAEARVGVFVAQRGGPNTSITVVAGVKWRLTPPRP